MSPRFERVALADVPWDELDALADRTVFQRRSWLDFLAASQGAEPVVAAVHDGPNVVAWFTGAVVRRFGLRVLGSPLPGWTTSYQGFNLVAPLDRVNLLDGLAAFAFGGLGCRHVEVMDRGMDPASAAAAGWAGQPFRGWELDLGPDPDALLAGTSRSCRWGIRKAGRNGLTVREAPDRPRFAATFHAQLTEVFARQGRRPTYGLGRVEALVESIEPERLLLLEVCRDDGRVIATGIFPGTRHRAVYWGGAGSQDPADRRLLPSEALMWSAVTTWRARGAACFDFGGGGSFKAKFGGAATTSAWLRRSDPPALGWLRAAAARALRRRSGAGS